MAKTWRGLYSQVYAFDSLHAAYCRARRGKRHQAEVLRFECDLEGELIQLQNELIWDQYETGPYRAFWVAEPKRRLVAALPFRDRVLQHALVSVLEPIWEREFIYHSYACRPGKGMHAGVDAAQRWMRSVQREHGQAYALKLDVRQYFASVDHGVLLGLLARRIRCPRTLALCANILGSWSPGIPIGNLTSQLFANIYLHELDRFAKQDLRVRHFARYMDDVLIVHHDKAHLHGLREQIERFLFDALALHANGKTQVLPVGRLGNPALDWLGYRLWSTHRRLRSGGVRRMRRRLAWMQRAHARGELSMGAVTARIRSWIGHAGHADSRRIREQLLTPAIF